MDKAKQFDLAWERNEPWVRQMYPELTNAELQKLKDVGCLPLPTGALEVGPEVVLELMRQIDSLASRMARTATKKKQASADADQS